MAKRAELLLLPAAYQERSLRESLELSRVTLRCISWDHLTKELFSQDPWQSWKNPTPLPRNVPEQSDAPSSEEYAESEALPQLGSRLLLPREKVDFFVSHCWQDDVDERWDALSKAAESFQAEHGRSPTLWIDAVCDDGSVDPLRALPVRLLSCKQMLVLYSGRYPQVLDCLWEMFAMSCFLSRPEFVQSVLISYLPLPDVDKMEVPDKWVNRDIHLLDREQKYLRLSLQQFRVDKTSCSDPNLDQRLRYAIEFVGKRRFRVQIASLGVALTSRRRKHEGGSWRLVHKINHNVTKQLRKMKTKAEASARLPSKILGRGFSSVSATARGLGSFRLRSNSALSSPNESSEVSRDRKSGNFSEGVSSMDISKGSTALDTNGGDLPSSS